MKIVISYFGQRKECISMKNFNKITYNEAERIKEILLNTGLKYPINFDIKELNIKVDINHVSEKVTTEHHQPYNMSEVYFMDSENSCLPLKSKKKSYEIYYNIGQWGHETRIPNSHIVLGTEKFHSYCFQLDLSDAIKDDRYIYLIKNVSNMAGRGALCRLYSNLGQDREKKLLRRHLFIEELGTETLKLNDKEWIVISKIPLSSLYDSKFMEDIFFQLVNNLLNAMFLVEKIVKTIVS